MAADPTFVLRRLSMQFSHPFPCSIFEMELPEEAETTEQISSDLQVLTRLYMLLHKGVAADEDVRIFFMASLLCLVRSERELKDIKTGFVFSEN